MLETQFLDADMRSAFLFVEVTLFHIVASQSGLGSIFSLEDTKRGLFHFKGNNL
jgi:hypothetical protein